MKLLLTKKDLRQQITLAETIAELRQKYPGFEPSAISPQYIELLFQIARKKPKQQTRIINKILLLQLINAKAIHEN